MNAPQARSLIHSPRVLVIAHRGDSKVAPENSLPAFTSALAAGADLVELDYVHSADGVPVVIHDETLDRTTNARQTWGGENLPVAERTLAELSRLDAGAWFGPSFAGTRLPTLEAALVLIQAQACTMIERKAGDAATVITMLERLAMLDGVILFASDLEFLRASRGLSSHVCLGYVGEYEVSPEILEAARQIELDVLGWNQEHLTGDDIATIHRQGLRAWSWTVDDADRAWQLVSQGIDGVISNVPRTMIPLARSRTAC